MQHRQAFVFGADRLVQPVDVLNVIATLGAAGQILILADRRIQFFQNTAIVDQQAVLLFLVQPVHPRNRLDQVVLFQRLVDVEHRVARLVETGEQLVHHDQQIRRTFRAEILDHLAFVAFRIHAHVILPPLLHLRHGGLIHILVPFAGVGRRHHHHRAHQPGRQQMLLIADRRQLAVRRHLPLQPHLQRLDVVVEMRGDVPGDQLDAVVGTVGRAFLRILFLQVRLLLLGQRAGQPLEPVVDGLCVHRQLRPPLLI